MGDDVGTLSGSGCLRRWTSIALISEKPSRTTNYPKGKGDLAAASGDRGALVVIPLSRYGRPVILAIMAKGEDRRRTRATMTDQHEHNMNTKQTSDEQTKNP